MSKPSKPTKGPWKSSHNEYAILCGEQSWIVITAPKRGEIGRFKRDADAKLAACAPELLESVRELLVCMNLANWENDPIACKARAAIAKATGGDV